MQCDFFFILSRATWLSVHLTTTVHIIDNYKSAILIGQTIMYNLQLMNFGLEH
jgi:hypothetical protein